MPQNVSRPAEETSLRNHTVETKQFNGLERRCQATVVSETCVEGTVVPLPGVCARPSLPEGSSQGRVAARSGQLALRVQPLNLAKVPPPASAALATGRFGRSLAWAKSDPANWMKDGIRRILLVSR